MSYFSHAFQQLFIGTTGFNSANAGSKPNALSALQMGLVDNTTNNLLSVNAAPSYLVNPVVYLAQGTSRTLDTHGMHGGFKETIKSKGINPKHVSDFYVVAPATPQQQIACIGCDTPHLFLCDQTWRLRIDIKGAPVLRYLTHQLYNTFDAYTGCCGADPTVNVDPSIVFEAWKAGINAHEHFKDFVSAEISYMMLISGTWTDVGNSAPSGDEVCSVTAGTLGSYSGGTVPTWTQSVSVGTGTVLVTHMEALTAAMAARGTGYKIGDIVEVVGGTSTNKATYTVTTTEVATVTLVNAGDGYTNADTLTIVGGTGTAGTITVSTVDAAGHILTYVVATPGTYTIDSTIATPAAVTGGTGGGATFNVSLGAETLTPVALDRGDYTVTPASPAATTAVTGSGTGLTLTALWRLKSVAVTAKGTGHDVAPTLTASSGAATATAVLCPDWAVTTNANRTAKLCLTAAYVDTVMGTCSFQLTDYYNQEPLRLNMSVMQDDGTPCDDEAFCFEITQQATIGNGDGNRILREAALFHGYLQDYWQHDVRLREIMEETLITDISMPTRYYAYWIQHNVPRRNNPTSVHDADQYVIKIVTTSRIAAFETWMNTYLQSAGNHVQLTVKI